MENHIHLLLKVFEAKSLAKLMQGLVQSYRFYYKKTYKYTGYLYHGRYKSKIVENDEYLLECARYIETNPLRAKIVEKLRDYKWSSYSFYAYGKPSELITPNPLYESFCEGKDHLKAYREYVLMPRMYEQIIDKSLRV
jgi:putative transposase